MFIRLFIIFSHINWHETTYTHLSCQREIERGICVRLYVCRLLSFFLTFYKFIFIHQNEGMEIGKSGRNHEVKNEITEDGELLFIFRKYWSFSRTDQYNRCIFCGIRRLPPLKVCGNYPDQLCLARVIEPVAHSINTRTILLSTNFPPPFCDRSLHNYVLPICRECIQFICVNKTYAAYFRTVQQWKMLLKVFSLTKHITTATQGRGIMVKIVVRTLEEKVIYISSILLWDYISIKYGLLFYM